MPVTATAARAGATLEGRPRAPRRCPIRPSPSRRDWAPRCRQPHAADALCDPVCLVVVATRSEPPLEADDCDLVVPTEAVEQVDQLGARARSASSRTRRRTDQSTTTTRPSQPKSY